jgi:HEAT repeat protein
MHQCPLCFQAAYQTKAGKTADGSQRYKCKSCKRAYVFTIDLLMEYAETFHHILHDVTYKALIELDVSSIENLFKDLKANKGIYVSFLCEKAKAAKDDRSLFALISALRTLGYDDAIIFALASLRDKRAIPIFREYLEREPHNIEFLSNAIVNLEYNGDNVAALQDESFVLRKYVARQFEVEDNTEALINALSNDSSEVRQIAAWYMGYKKVFTAKESLQSQLQQEKDTESRRAIEWALSILEI